MRAKKTFTVSINQLTLPGFEIPSRKDAAVLAPASAARGDAVREKLGSLGLTAADVRESVEWARQASPTPSDR
jgi:hypothetical protein